MYLKKLRDFDCDRTANNNKYIKKGWHVKAAVPKERFKYGTVLTRANFTSLSHSMTDAPLDLSPNISGCGYESI